ncbi:LysR family transcriptional regulator [Chitinibacter bivalviorum]|uniref:LysR family transcriptional regulator n=1 Tax=Chitinibacter bivalviorum TaxID=2739434 RepID=A0A7H9BL31_9NEIS|nr:LysR family transcriptional regulator [Chitinibacter bivalviorum]QLG89102.1 LysR family transcriptional regulator [Chitinibacter bivalviorum]
MNTLHNAPQLDWHLLHVFLAVVDSGSLSAAARSLRSSQPTLSRQIGELEALLGVALFERVARGLKLTVAGEALLPALRQMQLGANALAIAAQGQTQALAGTVRITASEMTACYILPPILARIRAQYPEIALELVVSNTVENLLERQADIAIRHTRPSQGGLIAKQVGEFALGLFAHRDYLQQVGGQIDITRIADYVWIGEDSADILLRRFQQAGFAIERDFFAIRCDNHIVAWQMALAGMGIGNATLVTASQFPQMQRIWGETPIPGMPVWLTAHRELRQSARIRAVFDALATELGQIS